MVEGLEGVRAKQTNTEAPGRELRAQTSPRLQHRIWQAPRAEKASRAEALQVWYGRLQGQRRHPGLRHCKSSLRLRCYLKHPRTRTRAELSGNGQGRLACCSPWGHRGLNNNNNFYLVFRAFATSVVSEKITTFWGDQLCSPSPAMRIHRRQGSKPQVHSRCNLYLKSLLSHHFLLKKKTPLHIDIVC